MVVCLRDLLLVILVTPSHLHHYQTFPLSMSEAFSLTQSRTMSREIDITDPILDC